MSFDFRAEKAAARQSVHDTLAVPAVYRSQDGLVVNDKITVRWHNKLSRNGTDYDGFDAVVVEGINRLIFNSTNLALAGLNPDSMAHGDTVTIQWPGRADAVFTLDSSERSDGPLSFYWSVIHERET